MIKNEIKEMLILGFFTGKHVEDMLLNKKLEVGGKRVDRAMDNLRTLTWNNYIFLEIFSGKVITVKQPVIN